MTRQKYEIKRFQIPVDDDDLRRVLKDIPPRMFSTFARALFLHRYGATEDIRDRAGRELQLLDDRK